MPNLGDTGSIVLGLVLVTVAGTLNGSWNVSFRPSHGFAVRRLSSNVATEEPCIDLEHHQAWILFQIYAVLLNVPVCLWWAGGPQNVADIVQSSQAADILLIVIFSLLWGVGSVGFGLACRVAGVGLDTNLCMGVIMVLGTFLPLCLEGAIATAAGGLVVAGLVLCCGGLALGVQSLQARDGKISKLAATDDDEASTKDVRAPGVGSSDLQHESIGMMKETLVQLDSTKNPPTSDVLPLTANEPEYSTAYKVAVCVIAGIFATQLQFAFVFGQGMIDYAEDLDGTPSSGSSAVIWLFAITLGAPSSILFGAFGKPAHIPWSHLYQCPWYRHFLIVATTSAPWVCHIHLYGFCTTLLPDDMAASVAWPILMMATVISGILWSIILGEWKDACAKAKRRLYQGLAVVTAGVFVIMSSVSL